MPYTRSWVPADVFLEHKGITIYRAYEDGDYDDGLKTYWFALDRDGEPKFDVRDLQTSYRAGAIGGHEDDIKWSLREAIDIGLLTQDGVVDRSRAQELVTIMKARYLIYAWSIDENGMVGFSHEGMFIVNPFASTPPWVGVDPKVEYGITRDDAEAICALNRQCSGWAW